MIKQNYWHVLDKHNVDEDILRFLQEKVKEYSKKNLENITYQTFRSFENKGDRKEFETIYFERRKRLTAFGLMAFLSPENHQYLMWLENEVWQVCQEFSWCLPAHIDPQLEGQSYQDYQLDGKKQYTIDLFAAETAFTLAELLHLFYNRLDPFLIEKVKIEVDRRVLQNFIDNGPFHWETATHNWASVCAGSIGSAAIYLHDNDTQLHLVIDRVVDAMNCYLEGYKADGACTEGYSYWQYGFGYFVYFFDLLEKYRGESSDIWQHDKVREIALFQQKIFLGHYYTVNFSDANKLAKPMAGFTRFLHIKFPEVHIPDREISQKEIIDHCGRWAPAFRELVWTNVDSLGAKWPDQDYQLIDSAITVSRLTKDNRTYAFAAKGGHNDEPHNHNDIGHFILFADNQYFFKDLGAGQYNKAYFGTERYNFICNSAKGHSVPIINGYYQSFGPDFHAVIETASSTKEKNVFSLAMENAYSDPALSQFKRTFSWEKKKPELILVDSFLFNESPVTIEEILILEDHEYQIFDHCVRLYAKDQTMKLSYDSASEKPVIERKQFINHDGEAEYFLLFCLTVKILKLNTEILFRFEWEEVKQSQSIQ
ncbi:hypothetical protein F9U64_13865 [Gracilibacillus oryzae]|uniref:Heparinase II/III-like C-terminal domain-containing protein n=1 Tax=Gracilibacillus oryzae TaxID=1672701 RepID=A0A7C8KU76_9BACI|nr:heparinase II/III family protein [Gracilibacillus oryzae]KAB8131057.1 hypothetical protein F9U64_13865 [Gracilibacillus oryzae]